MPELPIACTLTPEALRTRREGLLMDLVRRAERREDLTTDCVSSLRRLQKRSHSSREPSRPNVTAAGSFDSA